MYYDLLQDMIRKPQSILEKKNQVIKVQLQWKYYIFKDILTSSFYSLVAAYDAPAPSIFYSIFFHSFSKKGAGRLFIH